MRHLTTDGTLLLHTRADDGGDIIGTGYGMAVPYGVEIEFDGMRESFAPGAFDTTAVVGKPLAYRHNEPIGVITAASNEPDGLYIDFDVVNTSLGRDAATLMRTGSSRGLSVGFAPLESKRTQGKNAIVYTKAALAEVSLTHQPAYSTAGVGSIREDHMSVETVEDAAPAVVADIQAREAIDELRREVQSVVHVAEPIHPLAQFRSYGEYSKAVLEGFESRALFDQVTGDNPGVMPPIWLQQVRGIIDLGRPVITGVGGPQSAGTVGLDINWPYSENVLTDIVEAQANEKDEVNSVQISILKGTASLGTYAAGSDISYQLLQRSQPSYLDAHNRIMAASYATVTDRKFTSDIWNQGNGTVTYDLSADTTGAAFRAAVFEASMECKDATGAPATIVYASTALMIEIGGWESFYPAPYSVQNVSGVATASTLQVNVSGLRVEHAKWLDGAAARHAIVTNGEAARWIEDGPRLANAENVGQLGRDIAIYGYGVTAAYLPNGIVRLVEP
jgi:HK97 family phage prohead protease